MRAHGRESARDVGGDVFLVFVLHFPCSGTIDDPSQAFVKVNTAMRRAQPGGPDSISRGNIKKDSTKRESVGSVSPRLLTYGKTS